MPLNTSSSLLVLAARRHLTGRPRACEMFHQTLDISDEFLRWLLTRVDQDTFLNPTILAELLSLGWEGRKPMAARFYEAMGFESWTPIDSHSRKGTLAMDLNRSLTRDLGYTETFDFVNNNGSTEHVFDQRMVHENIHNLCRVGGIMAHKCPTLHVMNISFYGVAPAFFYDIAQANRYDLLDYRICNRWGDTVMVRLHESDPEPVLEFTPTLPPSLDLTAPDVPPAAFLELKPFISKAPLTEPTNPVARACNILIERARRFRPGNTGELHIMATFRKTIDAPFQVPYQHIALKDIEQPAFRERYRNQFEAQGMTLSPEDPPA